MDLRIDDDELAMCVSCGLCLPHCPTFRVTGDESRSPRGRITAMRTVQVHDAPADDAFLDSIETCVQCRACETACPSGVPFGHLVEATKSTLADQGRLTPWWQRWGLRLLAHHRLLLAGSTVLAAAQRLRLAPRGRFGLPRRLPLRRRSLEATGDDVVLFTGCVMDAWMRPVHAAAIEVLGRLGVGVALPGPGAACCGALHEHAGLSAEARRLAEATIEGLPGDGPVLVDAAGCGAMLKDYGRLLGTPAAVAFSARVYDIAEWLAERVDRLPPGRRLPGHFAVQDPCHLRHVQRAHGAVRRLLEPYADLVEVDDDGRCCGAGGAYLVTQPGLAGAIRDQKVAAIRATGADRVISANPGCATHLDGAGIETVHPVEVLAEALRAQEDARGR